jgi:PAS domain S-box-containing protein
MGRTLARACEPFACFAERDLRSGSRTEGVRRRSTGGDRVTPTRGPALRTRHAEELPTPEQLLGSHAVALLDAATDAVFFFDEAWRYTYANDAACAFLQRTREQLIGRECWELFPQLRREETTTIVQRLMQERRPAAWNAYSVIAAGWVQFFGCPFADRGIAVSVRSIDAQMNAERARQASERRFHALADLVPGIIWMMSRSGYVTWINQRWLDYSGLPLTELRGFPFEGVHPDDRDHTLQQFQHATRSKCPVNIEHRLRRRDGEYRWHLAQLQPILDDSDAIAYWLGTATDIELERRRLAAERDERRDAEHTRDHFHRVLAQVPVALAVFLGPTHILEVATRSCSTILGAASFGRAARECLPESALARGMLERLEHTYATGLSSVAVGEHLMTVACDGTAPTERIVDTRYTALTSDDGAVYGVLVTWVDVTARASARQHAEKESARLARVLEQAPFAAAITEGPEHVLRSANERQLRLFGHRPTLNMPLRAAFPERELEPVHSLFDRAFQSGEAVVLREQRVGWDRMGSGEVEFGYFDLIYQPITGEDGSVEGLLCVSTDVSESVNARLEVARACDEAERARAAAEAARDRLDHILAAVPSAIAVTRGPEHVYQLVNPTYCQLAGKHELLERRVCDVFPQVAVSGFIELLDQVYKSGEPTSTPERRVTFDKYLDGGTYEGFFSSFFAPLRTREGEITGVVASALEVTEQVRQRERNDELRQEAEAAKSQLEQAYSQLDLRIAERTLELARSNEALAAEIAVRKEAEKARNDLQRRLTVAREDEQRRTARDLHDQVGQTLSALTLAIKAVCEAERLPDAATTRLGVVLKLAERLGRDVHEIATRLRPAVLDAFGLHAALRQLLHDWSERCGVSVDFEAEWLKATRFPADLENTLYRVTQEALTNVARHARATHVSVVVERNAGQVIGIVEDNGVGFQLDSIEPGRMGLDSMRERVTLVGGTLDVESAPGSGTTIIVSIPDPGGDARAGAC